MLMTIIRITIAIALLLTAFPAYSADKITKLWAETCYEVQERFPEQVDCWEIPAPQLMLLDKSSLKGSDGTVVKVKSGTYIGEGRIVLSKRYMKNNTEAKFYETIVHEIVHYVLDYSGVFPYASGTEAECFSEYHAWGIADNWVNSNHRNSRRSQRSNWTHNYPQCSDFSVADYRAGINK